MKSLNREAWQISCASPLEMLPISIKVHSGFLYFPHRGPAVVNRIPTLPFLTRPTHSEYFGLPCPGNGDGSQEPTSVIFIWALTPWERMDTQSGSSLIPFTDLIPELMILWSFRAELGQLVSTQHLQNPSGEVSRRLNSHQLPRNPGLTALWFFGMELSLFILFQASWH